MALGNLTRWLETVEGAGRSISRQITEYISSICGIAIYHYWELINDAGRWVLDHIYRLKRLRYVDGNVMGAKCTTNPMNELQIELAANSINELKERNIIFGD